MAKPSRGVIFDVDGVLVDSYKAHLESWRKLAEEQGWELTEDQFEATFGQRSREIIEHIWGRKLDDDELERLDRRKEELYRELVADDFPAVDGARELIEALDAAGFALAVGSSGPRENTDLALAKLDAVERVRVVVSGAEVSNGKPDPEVYRMAAERLDLEPRRCAVIEDAATGLSAARAAGMSNIAIVDAVHTPYQLNGADMVITSLRQLSPDSLASLIDRKR